MPDPAPLPARHHLALWCDSGGLGNRLLTFSHVLAFAREHGFAVHQFFFARYAGYFRGLAQGRVQSLPSESWVARALRGFLGRRVRGLLWTPAVMAWLEQRGRVFSAEGHVAQSDPAVQDLIRHPRTVVWRAWYLDFEGWRQKHRAWLREIFRPMPEIEREVDAICGALSANAVWIGVHIRRGDYREWREGRHYFAHEYYAAMMEQWACALQPRPVHFLIASNEPVPANFAPGLSATILHRSEMVDLYTLARCRLIVGPFSTYSQWAVFYGEAVFCELDGSRVIPPEMLAVVAR